MNKKDPKMNVLRVLMWVIFAAWVCFLGYCVNGHNRYVPSSPQTIPDVLSTSSESIEGIDGPKTYFVREQGGVRGGSHVETVKLTKSTS